MTIEPNQAWGTEVDRPDDLTIVVDDARLARHVTDAPESPVAVSGGDLFRTLGARPVGTRDRLRLLPLDIMRVRLDGGEELTAVAHVVVRGPWWRGSWWRGPITVVMNVEFIGAWDVAPRGHPNDGRVERFDLAAETSIRQRRAIAGRLPSASHLPHPAITRRSSRQHLIESDRQQLVVLDGEPAGTARSIEIVADADACEVLA